MQRSRSQEGAIWLNIQSKLQALSQLQSRSVQNLKNVNILQGNVQNASEPFAVLRPKLERAYAVARNDVNDEDKIVKDILEQLSILTALRNNPEPLPVAQQEKRKKRKLEAGSPPTDRESPLGMTREPSRASPAPSAVYRTSSVAASRASSSKPSLPSGLSKEGSASAVVSSKPGQPVKKHKGPAPLGEGRSVAFKPPSRVAQSDREGWILTKVLRYLGQDRYEVQDIEDEENGSPGAIFPATSKQIVPLPDPKDRSTFPLQGYPAGTEVMALYPDTTTFYHAKIVGSLAASKNRSMYKVIFDDDNNIIKSVVAESVALWPK